MPAPNKAYEAVAHLLGEAREGDSSAVNKFYEERFPRLPANLREKISEWIIACDRTPDEGALARLREVIAEVGAGKDASAGRTAQIATVAREPKRFAATIGDGFTSPRASPSEDGFASARPSPSEGHGTWAFAGGLFSLLLIGGLVYLFQSSPANLPAWAKYLSNYVASYIHTRDLP